MEKTVFLAKCENYRSYEVKAAVYRILEGFGGPETFAKKGQKVLLKPNLVMASGPENAATTHPEVVLVVAQAFLEIGCSVTIADSSGGLYRFNLLKKLYERTGMESVSAKSKAVLNFDTESKTIGYAEGHTAKAFPIIQPVLDADVVINLGKMKTHGLTYYTGAVKNCFGCIPGLTKPVFHSRYPDAKAFCSMLVDLCECIKPNFSFIDGIVGMERHGPTGGQPKTAKVLIGARNPHAADLAAVHIMGFRPEQVPTLIEAIHRGLIPSSYKELQLLGDPVSQFETSFLPARKDGRTLLKLIPRSLRPKAENLLAPYPVIHSETCVGCGDCMRTCPQKTIGFVKRVAVIDYSRCIRCYCCQELCPQRAISLKRMLRCP